MVIHNLCKYEVLQISLESAEIKVPPSVPLKGMQFPLWRHQNGVFTTNTQILGFQNRLVSRSLSTRYEPFSEVPEENTEVFLPWCSQPAAWPVVGVVWHGGAVAWHLPLCKTSRLNNSGVSLGLVGIKPGLCHCHLVLPAKALSKSWLLLHWLSCLHLGLS